MALGTTCSGGAVGNIWLWLNSHSWEYKQKYLDSRFLITIKNRRHEVEREIGCGTKGSWKEVAVDGCEQYTLYKCIKDFKV